MSATRKAVLKHMLTVPMDLTEKDPPWVWAQSRGLSSISVLVALKDVAPHATYTDGDGKQQTLTLGQITNINYIIRWVRKEGLTYDWLTQATSDAFEVFQFEDSNTAQPQAAGGATTTTSASLTHRSMSKDLKQFKEIHKRYLYNSWIQTVKATAATQGVIHPFDPSYGPTGPEEMLIFNEENTYAYLIATTTIKYASGRAIIAKHAASHDGQAIFKELEKDASSMEVKDQNSSILEEKLRNMSADPEKWNRSLEEFLDFWIKNLITLEEVRGNPVSVSDKQKWLLQSL